MARLKTCWVEVVDGAPVRIVKKQWYPPAYGGTIEQWPRAAAVGLIRLTVYQRSKSFCEKCGERITWDQMHMDEKVSRSEGGEISTYNSWAICYDCHLGPDGEHGERKWNGKSE